MTTIIALEDGPIIFSGPLILTFGDDRDQGEVEGKVALCRCGTSQNKPFCDGAHKGIGFKAASLEMIETVGTCSCDCAVEAGELVSVAEVLTVADGRD